MSTKTTDTIEPDTDTVMVAGRSGGPHPSLHVPGGDGTPICDTVLDDRQDQTGAAGGPVSGEDRWREKDLAVYPEPWRKWCGSCLRKLREGGA